MTIGKLFIHTHLSVTKQFNFKRSKRRSALWPGSWSQFCFGCMTKSFHSWYWIMIIYCLIYPLLTATVTSIADCLETSAPSPVLISCIEREYRFYILLISVALLVLLFVGHVHIIAIIRLHQQCHIAIISSSFTQTTSHSTTMPQLGGLLTNNLPLGTTTASILITAMRIPLNRIMILPHIR